MSSKKADLFEALVTRLRTLSWAQTVEWEIIRPHTEFQANEYPAVQVFDTGEVIEHQTTKIQGQENIVIEVAFMRETGSVVNQRTLLERIEEIETLVGTPPLNLGVPGVIHLLYVANATDLHMIETEHYRAQLTFQVIMRRDFVNC